MKVTRLGHSGMAIETHEATLLFDFYTDPANLAPDLLRRSQRLYIMVSHSHRDHLCHDIFGWYNQYPDTITQYVIANECRRKLKRAISLDNLPVTFLHHDEDWTDGTLAIHTFSSTDVGVSFLATIDGRTVFHAGDFSCWSFSDDDESLRRKARGDFHAILRTIARHSPHIDVVMMPVIPNIGGDWAYGPRELLRAIRVDHFIPIHTWGRDREACQFQRYQNPDHGLCHPLPEGQTITID